MYRRLVILTWCLLVTSGVAAQDSKYSLQLRGGVARLNGGDSSFFPYQRALGVEFGYRFAERWVLGISYDRYTLYSDTTRGSSFALGGAKDNADMKFSGTRLGLIAGRDLTDRANKLRLSAGIGGGLMMWKIVDPLRDTALKVPGPRNENMEYTANEILFSGQLQAGLALSPKWTVGVQARADYFTGWGADFATAVKDGRDNLLTEASLTLTFSFGKAGYGWQSEPTWSRGPVESPVHVSRRGGDGDHDGVSDDDDHCPNSMPGVVVDKSGCALDSDMDGVADGRDDCPTTDPEARGRVDIHGCPVDSDFDGVADYKDVCPHNDVGAAVDSTGCPLDSDADGVPDGLDDCPYTLVGVDVDANGCIDLALLARPMVLNIDYVSGSFEVDPKTRSRLESLARILVFVKDVRIDINGYTDNIGLPTANQKLSEKRANRVRDFLATQGVAKERIKVFGRGETSFVASNDTAEGRAKNRRVELVFHF